MKKYLSFATYLVCIIAAAVILDNLIGTVVEKWMLPRNENKYVYAYYGGKSEDIVVFGASRASHHYVSGIIEDSLGVSVYNYGCDGQNIYNQYGLFNMLLNNCSVKPKLVILEVTYMDVLDTPKWNTEKINALFPYYSLDDSVKTIIVELKDKWYQYALSMSNLYRYNSDVHNYLRSILGVKNHIVGNKGYVPLNNSRAELLATKPEHYNTHVDGQKVEYLQRFIAICKTGGIHIVLLNSPEYVLMDGEPVWLKTVREIAKAEDVPFYDFGSDDSFISHREWFNERTHLNDNGAKEYTKMIIPIIRNMYYDCVNQ